MLRRSLISVPAHQGRACRQTKLVAACNKSFKVLKHRLPGIKRGCRRINTGASSYQTKSNFCFTSSSVNYALDANGAMLSDGLRAFNYDEANRLSKVNITKNGQAASVQYLTNAMGQRVASAWRQAGLDMQCALRRCSDAFKVLAKL